MKRGIFTKNPLTVLILTLTMIFLFTGCASIGTILSKSATVQASISTTGTANPTDRTSASAADSSAAATTAKPAASTPAPTAGPYTPYDLTVTALAVDETHPNGSVDLKFKIDNLQRNTEAVPWGVMIEKKIGTNDWTNVSYVPTATYLDEYTLGGNLYHFEQLWNESYEWTSDITVSYRVSLLIDGTPTTNSIQYPKSNIASIGVKASEWAVNIITRGMGYGLVPDSIKSDFTVPITREEFAELAVKLYEIYTKKSAVPVSPDPFIDCTNPEVLKAFTLGIVNGISATEFKPTDLTNREQIAAMCYRSVKAIAPDTDMSTAGSPVFSDAENIASYFLENVKFMSKAGLITGTDGKFNPKDTCTREMAVVIAVRVYEKYSGIPK